MDSDSVYFSLSGVPDAEEVVGLIRTGKDEILRDWLGRVRGKRNMETEEKLSEPLLLDHVPQLFDAIVERLEAYRSRDEAEHFAAVHGFSRRLSGYDMVEVVIELLSFRRAIWTHLNTVGAPIEGAYAVMERVDGMVDRAVITSLNAFLDPSAGMLVRVKTPLRELPGE